jgi:hypothetical protein
VEEGLYYLAITSSTAQLQKDGEVKAYSSLPSVVRIQEITIIARSSWPSCCTCIASCHPPNGNQITAVHGEEGAGQVRSGLRTSMHAAALHCTRLHGVLENSAVSRSAHQVMKSSMWRQGQNRHLPSPSEIARPRQCPSVIRRLLLAHPCLLAPSLAWQYKS